ncbi:sensor domain-containing protein [Sinorhizobium mexicanum]|uniref:EAL domain-containing protein n=1 Tax=Sinorhizobium mexicanum TaxID=375549 RepID=A0A859QWV6_9HYPH|nr:EAL domain-containing protein [Sinorhizobium mexicanum]MBP1886383.1 diguanylate cyclase (GGDEF)-like protein/PAS domain S-box-containing protein [Sinorhizobium mexicanum]QLL64019.1 EAL domain-containing protein [Sinorhizobium mexicanum]
MTVSRSGDGRKRPRSASSEDLRALRDVLNIIPLPVFIKDTNSRFLALNESMCEFMGRSHEQLVGKSDYDFVSKELADGFRHIDRQVLLSGEVDESEELLPRDGKIRSIVTRKKRARLPDGTPTIVACISDVTELQQRKTWWKLIFDQNPIPMWVFDRKSLQFLAVNQEAINHYGYSHEQFMSMTLVDIRPPEDAAAFREAVGANRGSYQGSRVWRHIKADGALIHVIPYSRSFELEDREAVLVALHDVSDLKRAEDHILHLTTHDGLTDLPNRVAFDEYLRFELERTSVTREPFAVLCLDLIRFNDVNDLFGYTVGDQLLQEVAIRLNRAAEGAFLARIGGDEFAIVVNGELPSLAANVADRLLSDLAEEVELDGRRLSAEACIGIAFYPNDGRDAATLLANAEAALSRAKADGSGVFRAFETNVDRGLRDRRVLKQDLRAAIERNELKLFYQPQADASGEIHGFEVLLRWQHPERGLVPPAVFVPLAEESKQIDAIGEWVLTRASQEAARWPKPMQIAVNLSPVQLQNDGLPTFVAQILRETGLAPERLELEVTETALFDDFARANSTLQRLRILGVKIAIDDFGTGYSSLAYLQEFPIDKIKIDRSFISRVQENNRSAAIVRAIIQLGLTLGMKVTAEGVENEDQLNFLRGEGCPSVQGYLIGKPLPIGEYAHLVGGSRA